MFKALLATSVAMLACCAAAVLAGPMQPPSSLDDSASLADPEPPYVLPLHLIALPQPDPAVPVLDGAANGFISVPLSATYDGSHSVTSDDAALLAPPPNVQSAVIPLPSPLYAALALIGVALIARRAMLRSC